MSTAYRDDTTGVATDPISEPYASYADDQFVPSSDTSIFNAAVVHADGVTKPNNEVFVRSMVGETLVPFGMITVNVSREVYSGLNLVKTFAMIRTPLIQ